MQSENIDHAKVLRESQDTRQVARSAVFYAASDSPALHAELLDHMRSEAFFRRMDTDDEYLDYPKRLRVRRVLDAMAKNKAPIGHKSLASLTVSPVFIAEPARVDLLITACAVLRPPPPEALKFWSDHFQPDDGFCHLTAEAVVVNGTEPALALLAARLNDPAVPPEDKLEWMRSSILTHRNDAPLLSMSERVLAGAAMPADLKVAFVEALFDYKPTEWYTPATLLEPPSRVAMTAEAKQTLLRISDHALENLRLPPSLAASVKATAEAIRKSHDKAP